MNDLHLYYRNQVIIFSLVYYILHLILFLFEIEGNARVLNLAGLPTEVLEKGIFPYLTRKELKRISLNQRLTDIANSVIDRRDTKCKYKLKCLLYENYIQMRQG